MSIIHDGDDHSPDRSNRKIPSGRAKRTPTGDYEVGFGKPPKHRQFGLNNPGNRAGRKRGSKNFKTLITAALDEKVSVTEGGKSRKVSRRELIAIQIVKKSTNADLKAIAMLLPILQMLDGVNEQPAERRHTRDDEAVLRGLRKRLFGEEDGDAAHS